MTKERRKRPTSERLVIRWRFGTRTMDQSAVEFVESMLRQDVFMSRDDDPRLRNVARKRLRAAAKAIVVGDITQSTNAKNGFSSGHERQAERKFAWDAWQAEANRLREKHPDWYKSAILQKVAEKFGKTRQGIGKRIIVSKRKPK